MSSDPPYTEEQTNRWLKFLALGMRERGQTIFQIEQLQPAWLPRRSEVWRYILISRSLEYIILFTFIISSSLPAIWVADPNDKDLPSSMSPLMVLAMILVAGALFGVVAGLVDALYLRARRPLSWLRNLIRVASVWAIVEAGLAISGPPSAEAWVAGILVAVMLNCLHFRAGDLNRDIRQVQTLTWSWRRAWVRGGLLSLLGGLICGAYYFLFIIRGFGLVSQLLRGCFLVFFFVFLSWPVLGYFAGLQPGVVDLSGDADSGMRLSLRNGVVAAMRAFVTVGPFYGLVYSLLSVAAGDSPLEGLLLGLGFAADLACIALLAYGHLDAVRHFTLRWSLARAGYLPYRMRRFLDYAARDLHILEVTGGGYMFIHRYLLEYFATLETEGRGAESGEGIPNPPVRLRLKGEPRPPPGPLRA